MCESQNKNNLKRVPDATVAEEIEEIVLRFDSDWGKTIPDMKDYFVDDSVVQGKLIKDLILVDQEYRWLRKEKITLADYLEKYSLVFRENPGALSLLIIEHFSLAYACKQNTNVDDYLSFTNFLEQEQRTVIFWKLVLIELNHGSSEKIDDYRKHYASIIDSAISPAFSVISKQFENDWIVHPYPKIARYLDYTNSSQRQQLLRELVLLDMTNCWRQGNPRGLEYYIDQFSPLLHADGRIPSELIIREKSLSATVKVSANRIRCAYCQRIQDEDGSELHCSFCGRAMTNPAFSGITPPVFTGYQIIILLGSGGFGDVYKAWDYTAYRMVALKVPKKQMLPMSHLSRFRREAVTVSHLHHPNIVPLYTYHIDDLPEHSFIAYEYVNGSILTAPIPRTEKEYKNIARMISGLVDGLHYAHRHRVIHRDIKPQNVFIDAEGKPRLSDFGLARQVRYSEVKNITVEGQLVGTPQYMSPEQMNGLPVDHRSDIYSVGVLLYFLLTGQVPFRSENMAELRHQITEFQVPPPRSLNPSIPDPLEKICLRALQKEPNNRYGKAANIAGDLRHYISGRNVLAKKPGISQAFLQWCWWYPRKATTRISLAIFPILIVLLLGYIQNIVKDKEDFSKNAWEKEFNVWKIYYQSLALQENARGEIAIGIDKDDLRYTQLLDYLRNSRAIKSGDRQELLLNCVRGNFRPVAQYLRGLKDNQGATFFLGNIYFLIGDQTAAIRLYKKALRSSLGKFTSKGTIYRNIGHCELNLGRPNDALISFRVALSADEQAFEKESLETAINWIFIGDAYYYLGEYNSSRKAFEKAYAIDANYLADIHPDIARDLDRLGGIWYSLGDYDQSVDFFRRALEIDIQIFTADHPAVARDWWHLGGPLYSLGSYAEAEDCFRNALVIFEKKYGKQDYRVSRAWDLIGGALHGQKRYQDALECFFLALEIDLQLYKDNPLHSNLARDYNHLGGVLLELKKYHEALAYFRQAHRIHRKTITKKQHPVYARNYERIAKAFLHLKQYNRALLFFEEALSIDIVAYGKNHSVVASDYHHLGTLYYRRGESSLARRYLAKALKVLTKNLGKKHQRVTDIEKLMEQLDRDG